ncbi:unnamed protein product [Pseudo-nitzschia multistriata]|uniref:15-cis-phytoene synthase n=1 Tax=Pseudo-nitzschia multistriata TaxID=183589 RepID=A0A448YYV3_9STRA|nr:unnamed protein product [Pseudo-nitzschia multistriata]
MPMVTASLKLSWLSLGEESNIHAQCYNRQRMTFRRRLARTEATGDESEKREQTNRAIQSLMVKHDPILLFASRLLSPQKAEEASALYAWCRRLDEICDSEENSSKPELVQDQLDVWQERFDDLWSDETKEGARKTTRVEPTATTYYSEDDFLMDLALKECIERYQSSGMLTRKPFDDMVQGMKSDAVEKRRIRDMAELELYGYRVAGTVGLMLLPLLLTPEDDANDSSSTSAAEAVKTAREPATCLGTAIQLVNILRDATQDAVLGRIYLPTDMLRAEGVTEEDEAKWLLEAAVGEGMSPAPDGYKRVVEKVSNRGYELLAHAEEGRSTLPGPFGPLLVQVIVELYRDYLEELKRRGYDNLQGGSGSNKGTMDRVKISGLRKAQASLRAIAKVLIDSKQTSILIQFDSLSDFLPQLYKYKL